MYVMERRLNMKWLAVFFAVATVISSFGTGSLPQSNNIAIGVATTFGIPEWITGGVLAIALGLVIVGGIKRIVRVAESIVPIMSVIYVVGALSVILVNLPQVGASFVAVFQDAFTGSAATGGFLGASFAYAFNRGVNRGLFSNEAGQGSAPIAHAAAKTNEPVSEGIVSILEPFIDTIIICTLTGLVILSSGVWTEKLQNDFQSFDTEFISGTYTEDSDDDRANLYAHLNFGDSSIEPLTGELEVRDGMALQGDFTLLHNRSIAEEVRYFDGGLPYSGSLQVVDGKLQDAVTIRGKSLIHSVNLTTEAFTRGAFGDYGKYIVAIGLVLFAFTTAVAWSYYGDRAMTYLFGTASVLPYRMLYVLGFFVAAISDTSLIWLVSAITIALMTIPNLIAILLLRSEMRDTIEEYWDQFEREQQKGR
jgi:AGCS family alanine or glycine:cation symporter